MRGGRKVREGAGTGGNGEERGGRRRQALAGATPAGWGPRGTRGPGLPGAEAPPPSPPLSGGAGPGGRDVTGRHLEAVAAEGIASPSSLPGAAASLRVPFPYTHTPPPVLKAA